MKLKREPQFGAAHLCDVEPLENLLGASMPPQVHFLGRVVSDWATHPNMDVGATYTELEGAVG